MEVRHTLQWSKDSQAARGLATVFSVTFLFSKNLVTIVFQLYCIVVQPVMYRDTFYWEGGLRTN